MNPVNKDITVFCWLLVNDYYLGYIFLWFHKRYTADFASIWQWQLTRAFIPTRTVSYDF